MSDDSIFCLGCLWTMFYSKSFNFQNVQHWCDWFKGSTLTIYLEWDHMNDWWNVQAIDGMVVEIYMARKQINISTSAKMSKIV